MRRLLLMTLAAVCLAPTNARAGVRVDQDEVIFTLRLPSATEVFLVGDFNQWNPTVEPMNRVDDRFEVGLFLVAGDYRYQFVVDGKWITDPDNPAPAGEKGSPLILVERGNALVMSTEVAGKETAAARAHPGLRYIGAMRADNHDSDTAQRLDLTVEGTFERIRARAAVATNDTSWAWSPLSVETWFDRGSVEVNLGKLLAQGFENDSTWASLDPTSLVGHAGVYDYDAGFRRHGVAGTVANSNITLHALYADVTTRSPAQSISLDQAALDGFIAGADSDTAMYATRPSFDDSDVIAFETVLDFGGTDAGMVFRREAGANPGVAADLVRSGSRVDATTYGTKENRTVSSVWAGYESFGARLTGTYGWGSVKAHAFGTAFDSVAAGGAIDAADATEEIDRTFPVLETNRGLLQLATRKRPQWHALAQWDFTRFDFDGLRGEARADVHRVTLAGADTLGAWTLGLNVRYTDADYGDTPDELAIDWPELNPWLSVWDEFDAPSIVALAFETSNVGTVSLGRSGSRARARADLTAALRGVAEELVHASARVHGEARVYRDFHAGADARIAWYDATPWTSNGVLLSGYLEASYRRGPFDLSAGFGFDPLVFDPVTSEYGDIGYTEFLRGALASGVARSRADDLVRALIDRERSLEDAAVFKIELVVDLR